MATKQLDLRGLKCPQPTLKLMIEVKSMAPGDIAEAKADCPTFADDVKKFCERTGKTLIVMRDEGSYKVAQIQI